MKKEEETTDKEEENIEESIKTLPDEEEDYFDYSVSDQIYLTFAKKIYNIIEEHLLTLLWLRIYLLKYG